MNETALAIFNPSMPALEVAQAIRRYEAMNSFISHVLREGTDYGKVPGTDKNTLLKPGAEKLLMFFGLCPTFEDVTHVEDWTGREHDGEAFLYYRVKCRLLRQGAVMAEGEGSCNSHESKYRWRWVQADAVPTYLDKAKLVHRGGTISEFAFAIDKAETGGKYGKPAEYWQAFKAALDNHTARPLTKTSSTGKVMNAWEIDSTLYRVPNDDIASQANTILKMAQKRALVAAALIGVNASDYFTQDVEDLPGFGEIIDVAPRVIVSAPAVIVEAGPSGERVERPAPEPTPADPAWDAMTSASAERPVAAPKAAETPGPRMSNPDPPAPTVPQPTGPIRPAAIDGAMFQAFNAWAADFAAANPHWQNKSGKADFNALCISIARAGYARITAADWTAIQAAMTDRAIKYATPEGK